MSSYSALHLITKQLTLVLWSMAKVNNTLEISSVQIHVRIAMSHIRQYCIVGIVHVVLFRPSVRNAYKFSKFYNILI